MARAGSGRSTRPRTGGAARVASRSAVHRSGKPCADVIRCSYAGTARQRHLGLHYRPSRVTPTSDTQRGYDPAGIHPGNGSVRCSHVGGGAPAFPAASTPPTMAQFVSTSPPAWAVAQKASS